MKKLSFLNCLIYILASTFLILNVSAWSVTVGTSAWPGAGVRVSFFGDDIPATVNIELSAKNSDGTYTSVGQTDFNVSPASYFIFSPSQSTALGMNYYIVAVDSTNPSNFAISGTLTVYDPFGDAHPTNSVTATGSLVFKTQESTSTSVSASTYSASNSASTISGSNPSSTITSSNNSSKVNSRSPNQTLQPGVIAAICIGCVILVILIVICCAKVIIPALKGPAATVVNYAEAGAIQFDKAHHAYVHRNDPPVVRNSTVKKPEATHIQDPFASSIAMDQGESLHNNDFSYKPAVDLPYPLYDTMPSPVHYSTLPVYEAAGFQHNQVAHSYSLSPKVEALSIAQKTEDVPDPFSTKEEYTEKPNDDTTIKHDKPHF